MNNVFQTAFLNIENTLPFKDGWKNKTGYFNKATLESIRPGEMARSVEEDINGTNVRRLIFIGTKLGTVVVFERYFQRYSENKNGIYVANFPSTFPTSFIHLIGGGSSLSQDTLYNWLGNGKSGSLLTEAVDKIYGVIARKMYDVVSKGFISEIAA